jgi:hypothetical protein
MTTSPELVNTNFFTESHFDANSITRRVPLTAVAIIDVSDELRPGTGLAICNTQSTLLKALKFKLLKYFYN